LLLLLFPTSALLLSLLTFSDLAVAPMTRIMICKIAIRHADKHNRPQGQTIYEMNQRLSVAL
jgi:hypothetical protein